MSKLIFNAKLLNIDISINDKGQPNIRLVFQSQRYDKGLGEIVPCSQNVKVIEDHHHMVELYKSFKGREIYIPIELTSMERSIFYKTTGDGKPLMLEEKKVAEQAPVKTA